MARITLDNIDLLDISIGNFKYWQIKMVVLLVLVNILIISVDIGNLFMVPPFELWCDSKEKLQTVLFKKHLPCIIGSDIHAEYINSSTFICMQLSMHNNVLYEWNLSNQRKEFTDTVRMLITIGTAVGGLLFGRLADLFGRKFILIILILLQTLCGIISSIANAYGAFLAFKFISGMFNAGIFVTSLVLCVEVAGKKFRTYIPAVCQLLHGIAYIIFAGVGCCIFKWREFQLLLAAINVLFLTYFWVLNESPRWLVVNSCRDELVKLLNQASSLQNIHQQIVDEMCHVYAEVNTSVFYVFFHAPLKNRMLTLGSIWFILGVLWEFLFEYVGEAYNNPYNYVLAHGAVLILGVGFLLIGSYACGRQVLITSSICFVTFCLFGMWIIPGGAQEVLKNFVISEIGFLGLSVVIPSTYLFTLELLPTVLRGTIFGVVIIFFYIGTGVVSLIHLAGFLFWVVPGIIIVCLVLMNWYMHVQETKDAVLPNVLSDIRNEEIDN